MSDEIAFVPFSKIARLSRNIVITEKIDGTNAQIFIDDLGQTMRVGSRNQWIDLKTDNHGFARWAEEHKDELMKLGPGAHFGEWWGSGIQRGYGLQKGEKRFSLFNTARWSERFSLFNTARWSDPATCPSCCHVVPVLWSGLFESQAIDFELGKLIASGSIAAPGFMDPEGIVIWHEAARQLFKKTIKGDEKPKGSKEIG